MKTNLQFFLNSYNDLCSTTTPSQNNFKWLREINGIPFNIENSQQIQVPISVTTPNLIPYPFSNVVASGNITINGTTTATISGSIPGIIIGQLIVGNGIAPGTTVKNVVGSTLTLSMAATASGVIAVSFYNAASFLYMESDQQVSVIYNNGTAMVMNPFEVNGLLQPAVFFMAGPVHSVTVTNSGTNIANVFLAAMG